MRETVGVILAGGEGRRIGGGKPDVLFGGRRLIDIAAAHIAEWDIETAFAVKRSGQVRIGGLIQITDTPGIDGPLGGLLSALMWARRIGAAWLVTLPCDMPHLPGDMAQRLWLASSTHGLPAMAASAGRVHPVCAVWPTSCLEDVESYIASGQRSLRGALEQCSATIVEWATRDGDPFANINTREDLHTARQKDWCPLAIHVVRSNVAE